MARFLRDANSSCGHGCDSNGARQLAVDAIDEAIAQGGDQGDIDDAQTFLSDGDALRAFGNSGECGPGSCACAFKSAVNKYKDALAKAEGALP